MGEAPYGKWPCPLKMLYSASSGAQNWLCVTARIGTGNVAGPELPPDPRPSCICRRGTSTQTSLPGTAASLYMNCGTWKIPDLRPSLRNNIPSSSQCTGCGTKKISEFSPVYGPTDVENFRALPYISAVGLKKFPIEIKHTVTKSLLSTPSRFSSAKSSSLSLLRGFFYVPTVFCFRSPVLTSFLSLPIEFVHVL